MSKLNNGDVTDVLDSFFLDYAIDDDDDEATVKELMKQRSDMNKAVNEWYAKAKAWEKYKAHMESHIDGEINEEEFVSDLKSDYFESGEYDA